MNICLLIAIERDPDMFDGALIGAPAWDTKNLMPWISQLAMWNLPEDADGSISDQALFSRLQAEVLKQCDPLDGMQDGIVSSLSACREQFDITQISCDVSTDKTACWTQAQIETAQKMYSDYITEGGELVYSGLDYSSEAEWGTFLMPASPNDANNVRRSFDAQYERTFMDYGNGWQITSYNDSVVDDARARDKNSVHASADQFDLGSFRGKGKISTYDMIQRTVPSLSPKYFFDSIEAS